MKQKHLTQEEQVGLQEKLNQQQDTLLTKLEMVRKQYVEAVQKENVKKRPNVKKLNRLERTELKIKTQIQSNQCFPIDDS